jgi:hypothetical protein
MTHGNRVPNDDVQLLIKLIPICDDLVVAEGPKHAPHRARACAPDVLLDIRDGEAGFVSVGDAEKERAGASDRNVVRGVAWEVGNGKRAFAQIN